MVPCMDLKQTIPIIHFSVIGGYVHNMPPVCPPSEYSPVEVHSYHLLALVYAAKYSQSLKCYVCQIYLRKRSVGNNTGICITDHTTKNLLNRGLQPFLSKGHVSQHRWSCEPIISTDYILINTI
jgi:hypothetical protein